MRNKILVLMMALLAGLSFPMSRRPAPGEAAWSRAGTVTVVELDRAVDRYLRQMKRLSPAKEFTAAELEEMRNGTLDDLVLRKIFVKMAEGDREAAVPESDVRERYLIVCSGIFNNNEEDFRKALIEDGWTEAEYMRNLREIILSENMRRKVVGEITVTPAQVHAWYEAHLEEFRVEEAELAHILVAMPQMDAPERDLKTVRTLLVEEKTPPDSLEARVQEEEARRLKKMNDLLDSVRAGADFAALARRHSDDGSAAGGGTLGVVARGVMVKPFEEAGFALKKGEVSGVVRTEFGYHIIKALRDPASRVQTEKEMEMQIEGRLRAAVEAERIAALMKRWKVVKYVQ